MAPSWGTSCLRSSRRILSTESTRGERPPCTQRMAPVELLREPEEEDVADVPAGPVLEGVGGAMGEEEPIFAGDWEGRVDMEGSEFRA